MVVCHIMMNRDAFSKRLVILWLLLLLAACMPPTPIPVFITPTPETPTLIPTVVPTLEPLPSATEGNTGEPTRTPLLLGAVVGPEYTLHPSNTPRATRTPIDMAPQSTAQPAATETPILEPTLSPTPLPLLSRQQVGVQVDTNLSREDWDFYLARAKELGVGWIKVQASWAFLQPNGANPDDERLRLFELNLQTANQYGFKVLLSVAKAPVWTRSTSGDDAPPDNPQELANFFNMMFQHTKIGEVVNAIEVWNEPNLHREWNTTAMPFSGAGYMQLFRPAYDAIRAYRSDIVIVTAGLAPTTTIGTFSIDDRDYLRQMYAAGLGQYPDVVVGVHPYGWGNAPDARCCAPESDPRGWNDNPHFFFLDNLDATRAIMNEGGHANVPMWVTEFGWATWQDLSVGLPDPAENNQWMTYNSPEDQANYTIRALEIAQKERQDVGMMTLWNLNYANTLTVQNRQEIVAYSLFLPDQNPRLLFYLLPLALGD